MIGRTVGSKRRVGTAVVGLVLCVACAHAPRAEGPLQTTARSRISDEAIGSDHAAFTALQARIRALNEGGIPIRDYHLAKAQAYLDFAFDEYHENDRTDAIRAALSEATALVDALERKVEGLGAGTTALPGEERLRPDLWALAEDLKTQPGFACAGESVARLEVALLHAGHELRQGGWRRASPHVAIAEDLAARARAESADCQASRR